MKILGISAYFHDSAASIIIDGKIAAAAQEERYTRIKHDSSFPKNAILHCLKVAECKFQDIDNIVFYDKPLLKFERLLESYMAYTPKGFGSFRKAMPTWLKEKLFIRDLIEKEFRSAGFEKIDARKILFSEHHLSHAASAFYPSPFDNAAIVTIDGVGEWATTTIAKGNGNDIKILKEIHFPHSLGLLYSAFTTYCGFKVNSGEYKLMGLAPYGKASYADTIRDHLIDIKEDGSYALNMDYFEYPVGLTMTSSLFDKTFGGAPRTEEEELTQRHMDIAASIQFITEEVVEKLVTNALKSADSENLCMAGGVALNCVANGKIQASRIAKKIWIQPAAGDAGGAIGAALAFYYQQKDKADNNGRHEMTSCYLGQEYSNKKIADSLEKLNAKFIQIEHMDLVKRAAQELAQGKALGWFQGKMEFGPRALGNRSILADPRPKDMQKKLNLKIKFRESFRPFAPVVLAEKAMDIFEMAGESANMMFTYRVKKFAQNLNDIPAVTHVDGSARVQTVSEEQNQMLHGLLTEFDRITGCPVLVNTSFNVRGEPLVNSPEDAYRCFMSTDLDALVMGNCYLLKSEQPMENRSQPKVGND